MGIVIERYGSDLEPAVRAFNQRLASGAAPSDFRFPKPEMSSWPALAEPRRPYEESFVAVDARTVRGTYILKHQDFVIRGVVRSIAQYRSPISEGIIDRRYVGVGVRLLRHALESQPMLFALGMGGFDHALPRMLRALSWRLWTVPFYFRACHPHAVVRAVIAQRAVKLPPVVGSLAVKTGLAGVALGAIQRFPRTRMAAGVSWKIVDNFDGSADVVWQACADQYLMMAVRTSEVLNALYPPEDRRVLRVMVYRDGAIVGWIVLLDTAMKQHRQFGDLRVGSIVDGLARPEHARMVVSLASRILEDRGVDLIVSNQTHIAWTRAMRSAGLLRGPSNFIFACSPALGDLLEPFEPKRVHVTRGDGDGPIHL